MFDEGVDSAQAGGAGKDPGAGGDGECVLLGAANEKREHAAKGGHLAGSDSVPGVRGKSRIVHAFDARVRLEKVSETQGGGRGGVNSQRQSGDATQGEPAIKGRRDAARIGLGLPRALEKIALVAADEGAARKIRVSADVFRGGVHDEIDAVIERPLENGRRERRVAGSHDVAGPGERGDRGEIGDLERGVGRRFDPDETRGGANSSLDGGEVGEIDGRRFESGFGEDFAEKFADAVVDLVGDDEVIARLERLEDGVDRGHAAREAKSLSATLEIGEAFFQGLAIGIILAAVFEAERIGGRGRALEGGGEMNGRRDGAGGGIDAASRMDRASLEVELSVRHQNPGQLRRQMRAVVCPQA